MSKLDELIKKYCPDGVKYFFIEEICDISRGKVISKIDITNNVGIYPVYSSQTENNGELGKINSYMFDGEYVTWTTDGANAGSVFYRTGKFNVTNVCGLLKCKNGKELNTKYLSYILKINTKKHVNSGMGNPKLMSNQMAKIKIPLPPIEVQNEIVRILDSFTQFEAELTAELTLRKKQYEYYRDSLLSFGEGIPTKTLGQLLDYTQPTKYIVSSKKYDDSFKTPVLTAGKTFVLGYTDETNNIYKCSLNNPVIIFDDFTCANQWVDFNFKVKSSAMKILTPKQGTNLRYVFYQMQKLGFIPGQHARHWISIYSQLEIPFPSIDEQNKIVKLLDNFDNLTKNISSGLPKEIELIHKQYEYYRNKLLTFKELKD